MNTEWSKLPHECPKEMEPYLLMACQAVTAESKVKVLTRLQKVMRKIHDDVVDIRQQYFQNGLAEGGNAAEIAFDHERRELLEALEAIDHIAPGTLQVPDYDRDELKQYSEALKQVRAVLKKYKVTKQRNVTSEDSP